MNVTLIAINYVFWITYRNSNEVHTKHGNLFVSLESEQKQGRDELQFIAVEVIIYSRLFIFDSRALSVGVTGTACLRMGILAHCFKIFGSLFGLLFCLRDRK